MPNGSSDTVCNIRVTKHCRKSSRRACRDATSLEAAWQPRRPLLWLVASVRCQRRAALREIVASLPSAWLPAIPVSSADTVVVPPGYTAKVLIAWGDPVSGGPAFKPDASNTAAEQARQWGMHNDGMVYFPIDGSSRRPARSEQRVHRRRAAVSRMAPRTGTRRRPTSRSAPTACRSSRSPDSRGRARTASGEIDQATGNGEWQVVRPSHYARRITGQDADPDRRARAAGDRLRLVITSADPTGAASSARSTTARWASRRGART